MTDNIISFPGTKESQKLDKEERMTGDELLEMARGSFDDVIIIGSKGESSKFLSNISIDDAIYELTRTIHILNNCLDRM